MPLLPTIRRSLGPACVVALAVFGGCKDQRGDPEGPDPGIMDGELTFFTGLVTLSIHNYQNLVAQEVIDIVLNGTPTPIFTPGCVGSGTRLIRRTNPADPTTFTVEHPRAENQEQPFIIFPDTFSSDFCDGQARGLPRYSVAKDMIVSVDPDALPDSLRFTITLPDDGSSNPGVVYQLPDLGGVTLAASGTVRGELVDIEYDEGTGEILRGSLHLTGTLRLEDRSGGLFFVQELDLYYPWEPPLPFAPFPMGTYEITGFTHSTFTGPIVGNPIEITWDGFSQGTYTGPEGQLCTIDLLGFTNSCGF